MLALIVAKSDNNVIGNKGKIPWRIPEDLKFFKEITKNNVVIMGRKTFESIGFPLPNRHNIVISRNPEYVDYPIATFINDLDDALAIADSFHDEDIFIIGGYQLYKDTIDRVDTMYITEIHSIVEGDTIFPSFNVNDWDKKIIKSSNYKGIGYDFVKYTRL